MDILLACWAFFNASEQIIHHWFLKRYYSKAWLETTGFKCWIVYYIIQGLFFVILEHLLLSHLTLYKSEVEKAFSSSILSSPNHNSCLFSNIHVIIPHSDTQQHAVTLYTSNTHFPNILLICAEVQILDKESGVWFQRLVIWWIATAVICFCWNNLLSAAVIFR
jgi:hypothetical protein